MSDTPRTSRSTLMVAVGAVVIVLLAATVVVLLIRGGDEDEAKPDPGSSATGSKTPAANTDGSVCGLEREPNQSVPTSEPDVDWYINGRIATPESDQYGPGTEKDGIHSCFSSGPYGALLAAVNVAADMVNPDVVSDDVVRERLVQNSTARKLIGRKVQKTGPVPQIQGFAFDSFSAGDQATVRVAYTAESGGYFGTTYALQWVEGDWRVVVNSTESTSFRLNSLDGFIEWGGL